MSCTNCPGPSPAISLQFILQMSDATGNRQKITKNPYFGNSRSFKVINVDTNKSLSLLLVMIRSVYVPICNCFHATRANSGKITLFVFDALNSMLQRTSVKSTYMYTSNFTQ